MSYAARWVRFWSVVVALGVGLSFVVWHAVPGLVSLAAATAFVALSLVMVASAPDPSPPRLVLRGWRHLAVLSLATGSGGLAVVTVAVVFWPAAVLLAGGAAASCPWTVRRVRSVIDRQRPPVEVVETVPSSMASVDEVTPVRDLSNEELCAAWRRSFVELAQVSNAQQQLIVVAARQQLLDEMERRSPAGFGAWLASGARAGGAPDRYLSGPERPTGEPDAA